MTSPQEPDRLADALLNAFDEQSFEKLLFESLNKKIFDLIPYNEFVAQVAKVAREKGWTNELINAALKINPRNSALLEVAVLEPVRTLITEPPDTSSAAGGEVARALGSLIEMLKDSDLKESQSQFGEINAHLEELYGEYQTHAATIAP